MVGCPQCEHSSRGVHEAFFETEAKPGLCDSDLSTSSTGRAAAGVGSSWRILVATSLAIAVMFGALPKGRYVVGLGTVIGAPGLCGARSAFPHHARRSTKDGAASGSRGLPSRKRRCRVFTRRPVPRCQRLMRYAGLDPDHGLLRWGNYDRTLLLPSTIFEADESGRSYRLRPASDAIWLRQISIRERRPHDFPRSRWSGPGRGDARGPAQSRSNRDIRPIRGACAGPSPTLTHPCAGIVLGDSFMQGHVHRRRRDPAGVPAARSRKPLEDRSLDPQHGTSRLLARAILLFARRIRRSFSPPLRRRERLQQ